MKAWFLIFSLTISSVLFGQAVIDKVRTARSASEETTYQAFVSFLKIPNVATDTDNIRKNADFLLTYMREKGIGNVQLLEGESRNVPPVVYGEVDPPGATKTVVFYAHYDGQLVNPATWAKGLHPFIPQLLNGRYDEQPISQTPIFPLPDDWRIYARGASDDKGGVFAIIAAFQAIQQAGLSFPYRIRFFFEGEEEQGSPHLRSILEKYKSLVQSDLWIICDGPVHQSGYKQIVFGARGDAHLTLKVYGPKNPLHSGHYGNWVPNPILTLSKLLASMKDDKGKVIIKDFYTDITPLTATEKKALNSVPDIEEQLKKRIGFAKEEMHGIHLNEAINLPSLNINGIESSNVGTIQANVIPTTATAVLDLRLVLGNDWKRQQQKVIDHIVKQGFYITEKEPTDAERQQYEKIIQIQRGAGNNAQRTSMELPFAQKVVAAVQQTTKYPVLRIPTLGGSLPIDDLVNVLDTPFLIIPIANYDNNQHAENENIRIQNFREGIDMLAAIMMIHL